MLQLCGVSKSFSPTAGVYDIDLHIRSGQVTVLIGPSGCGKSTLLRLMLGILQPDGGTITFRQQPLSGVGTTALRRKMGYVIQSGGLFPHLTARQNIALMPSYLKWPAARIEARLEQLAELTHFPAGALHRYPAQLSGGQRQRVGLMRGLVLDPELLLLDEPLGALDPMVRGSLQTELQTVFRDLGKTVVLVTHDLREAAYFADHIVLMQAGRIMQQGSVRALWDAPADPFVSAFIESQRGPVSLEEVARR